MTTKLKTTCPHCEKRLRIDESKRGKAVRCPACGEAFTVNEAFTASEVTIDTAPAAVSVDTTELANKETLESTGSPAAKSTEESTPRRIGRFELKSILGAGGFGKVYRAYDPQLERFVALKIPTFGPKQKTRVQRFLAEAKAAARLKHNNIVSTYESGKADKKYYIASEFIEGDLLSNLAKKERPSVTETVQIVRKLAEALAYAHSQGIVHRDIKPHNVIIDTNGEPQLMDFGLAKRSDDSSNLTTDGALLGTPAYMAPEQARGELHLVNPLSDQYSLGVILFNLLTGTTPCEGSSHMVVAEVAKGDFFSVRERNGRIDRTLDAICQKAMHPEQSQRYADCSEFAADLDAWANGDSVLARPQSSLQKFGRQLTENALMLAMFASIFVLAIVVAVFGYRLMRGPVPIEESGADVATTTEAEQTDQPIPQHLSAATITAPTTNASLLDLVDPVRCAIKGAWTRSGETLECGSAGACRVQVPYSVSGEYDLEVTVEPISGVDGLAIGLTYNSTPFHVLLSYRGANQIENIGTHGSNSENPSRTETPVPFKIGELSLVRCSVRDGSIKVTADGVTLIDWSGDMTLLNQNGYWKTPYNTALYLGAFGSEFRFHNATIQHISGTAVELKPPLIHSEADAVSWASEFGPGVEEAFRVVQKLEGTIGAEQNDENAYRLKVTARGKRISDSDLAAIAALTGPVHLSLDYSSGFGVAGFQALSQMQQLEIAGFRGSPSINDELAMLLPPEHLVYVGFDRTNVTDSIAPHVARMRKLRTLRLQLSQIGPETAHTVTGLPNLESVWFGGSGVSDDVIRSFSANSPLRDLRILNGLPSDKQQDSPTMTEDCLQSLLRLKDLKNVALERTGISSKEMTAFVNERTPFKMSNKDPLPETAIAVTTSKAASPKPKKEIEPGSVEDWLNKVKARLNSGDLFGAFVLARGLPDDIRSNPKWKDSPEIKLIEERGSGLLQMDESDVFVNTNVSESADSAAIRKRVTEQRRSSQNVAAIRVFVENLTADVSLTVESLSSSTGSRLKLTSQRDYGYSSHRTYKSGETVYVYSEKETRGILRISALRHNPIEFSVQLASTGDGYQGAVILKETPADELGTLSIQLVPETGTQLSDYDFATASVSFGGLTSNLPEFTIGSDGKIGPLRVIPASSYYIRILSSDPYGVPPYRLKPDEAIVVGKQTKIQLPVNRQRMVTFEWRYRRGNSGPWRSGELAKFTGVNTFMRDDWPETNCFLTLPDWGANGTTLSLINPYSAKVPPDQWPPGSAKAENRPPDSLREQPIAAGDVFAIWNRDGRPPFQAMLRVKSIELP